MNLHILLIFVLSYPCVLPYDPSTFLFVQMTSYILSKYMSSRHCGWAGAFLRFQLYQMNFCSGRICMPFLWCGLPCAPSDVLLDQMTSYILSKCGSSLHCGWSYAFPDWQLGQKTYCIGHNCMPFLCIYASSDCVRDQTTFYILSKCVSVSEHVRFQSCSLTKWLLALDTIVRRDLSCLATRIEEILGGFIARSRDQNWQSLV